MSKIRTSEQLVDYIDEDLAWRKRELSAWSSLLHGEKGNKREAYLRGAWTLLYAHWEGFVKSTATAYLQYVSLQGLTVDGLTDSFVAISLRSEISSAGSVSQAARHTELVAAIRDGSRDARIPFDSATIRTHSNLKFETFTDVLLSIGCDPSPYIDLQADIDKILLKNRNDIAHGKYLAPTVETWEEMKEKVLVALNLVQNQVQNAALTQSYRRTI